jgi:hypothetical protein
VAKLFERRLTPRDSPLVIFATTGAFLAAMFVTALLFLSYDASPFQAYFALFHVPFRTLRGFGYSLVWASPLVLIALGTIVSWRSGFSYLGFEGCFVIGASATTWLALLTAPGARIGPIPFLLFLKLAILFGFVSAGVWAGRVGLVRAWLGGNAAASAHSVVVLHLAGNASARRHSDCDRCGDPGVDAVEKNAARIRIDRHGFQRSSGALCRDRRGAANPAGGIFCGRARRAGGDGGSARIAASADGWNQRRRGVCRNRRGPSCAAQSGRGHSNSSLVWGHVSWRRRNAAGGKHSFFDHVHFAKSRCASGPGIRCATLLQD